MLDWRLPLGDWGLQSPSSPLPGPSARRKAPRASGAGGGSGGGNASGCALPLLREEEPPPGNRFVPQTQAELLAAIYTVRALLDRSIAAENKYIDSLPPP